MDLKLAGHAAIVTGAGRGIGAEIARTLAREGCKVAVWDINGETAENTAGEIAASGREAFPIEGDIGDSDVANRNVRLAFERFGSLQILVNNAAIVRFAPIQDMTSWAWDEVIRVTLTGAFNCTRSIAPHFISAGYGRVINIASRVHLGDRDNAGYVAAKAGVIGLTRATALELAPYAVTANAIAPGLIATEGQRKIPGRKRFGDARKSAPQFSAMERPKTSRGLSHSSVPQRPVSLPASSSMSLEAAIPDDSRFDSSSKRFIDTIVHELLNADHRSETATIARGMNLPFAERPASTGGPDV
jgi:3-oxoacyl-[acyl-carrier protein] reductase